MKPTFYDKQLKQPIKWIALVSHYENMHRDVYKKMSGHIAEPLYLTTSLESLLDRSPLVISLEKNDPLIHSLPEKQTIYFTTSVETRFEHVLEQLRNRLHILFEGNRKGLFHYYLPSVASYFFSRADQSDTGKWLGCLSSISFYKQIKSENSGWLHIEGEFNSVSDSAWLLSESQEKGLNDKYIEQQINQWAETENIQTFDWNNHKNVCAFCTQHQIEEPKLLSRLHYLVHTYNVLLDEHYPLDTNQTSESIVKQLEQLISREHHHVC